MGRRPRPEEMFSTLRGTPQSSVAPRKAAHSSIGRFQPHAQRHGQVCRNAGRQRGDGGDHTRVVDERGAGKQAGLERVAAMHAGARPPVRAVPGLGPTAPGCSPGWRLPGAAWRGRCARCTAGCGRGAASAAPWPGPCRARRPVRMVRCWGMAECYLPCGEGKHAGFTEPGAYQMSVSLGSLTAQ
jgi:hypothetical protein